MESNSTVNYIYYQGNYTYGWAGPWSPCVCPCCGRCRNDRIYMAWQPYWIWSPNDNPTITVNMTPEVYDVAA